MNENTAFGKAAEPLFGKPGVAAAVNLLPNTGNAGPDPVAELEMGEKVETAAETEVEPELAAEEKKELALKGLPNGAEPTGEYDKL